MLGARSLPKIVSGHIYDDRLGDPDGTFIILANISGLSKVKDRFKVITSHGTYICFQNEELV